jgi:transcriptional regulator with XRE-family HTH domain
MQTNYKAFVKAFGRVVRRRRQELELSQESFAELLGLHRTYVGSIERGERNVSLRNLLLFGDVLNVALSQLIKQAEEDSR